MTYKKRKKYISLVAQVLLSMHALLFAALIMSFFSSAGGMKFLDKFITSIPFIDPWLSLITTYSAFSLENIATVFFQTFFEALIIGMCINISDKIADFFHKIGFMPYGKILVTAVGIIFGIFLCSAFDSAKDAVTIITVGFMMIIGIFSMLSSVIILIPKIFTFMDLLAVLAGGVVAVTLSGYVTALYLFQKSALPFTTVLLFMAVSIATLLILYAVEEIQNELK